MAQAKKYAVTLERTETTTVIVEATSERQAAFNAALSSPTWDTGETRVVSVAWREGGE